MSTFGPAQGATALQGAAFLQGASALQGATALQGAAALQGAGGSMLGPQLAALVSGALTTNRDGIVGYWQPPGRAPAPLPTEYDELQKESISNPKLWGAGERAGLYDFDLISRLHFAAVKDGAVVRHVEPDPPSSPTSAKYHRLFTAIRPDADKFRRQLDLIDSYAEIRSERAAEILAQLGPPIPFFSSIVFLDATRTRWTLELLSAALRLTFFVSMRVKHALACRRPHEYSSQIQPIIPAPLHGSLPSGHATEAFAIAIVLCRLLKAGGRSTHSDSSSTKQLMNQAARIAINRTVAGVHFPVDSAAGAALGLSLGEYFVSRCSGGQGFQAWRFDGQIYPDTRDFFWEDFFDAETETRIQAPLGFDAETQTPIEVPFSVKDGDATFAPHGHSTILKWLWDKAVDEWR